jgi:hypothetical protein
VKKRKREKVKREEAMLIMSLMDSKCVYGCDDFILCFWLIQIWT